MNNQLAVGAAGGSLASLVLRILASSPSTFPPVEHLPCRFEDPFASVWHLDWVSFGLGILVGLVAGPIIEFLWLVKQWLSFVVRRQFRQIASGEWPLYREGH